jgi:alpha-galactosidase
MPIITTAHGWALLTERTAYACAINPQGALVHTYWGPRLPYADDYPAPAETQGWASFNGPGQVLLEEYPAYGEQKYIEPCLKAAISDSVHDVIWAFEHADITGETLTLHLHDRDYPSLRVALLYRVHAPHDVIERAATLHNAGATPIVLERAFSAQWHLPSGDDYHLTHLTGRWLDEFHIRREPLTHGTKVLESRRLYSGHHHSPFFMIERGASETQGAVFFGALAWSGNWKLTAEVTDFAATRVSIGLNDWDFAYTLAPSAEFTTPAAYAGMTVDGFGAASQRLHDLIRSEIVPHGDRLRKVLYNSWEATMFDVNVASQSALADHAAAMGVELFVVDDGWFHGRNSDTAGLGDWWPDARKFPDGLTPLIEHVNRLGMDFGLWLEPEMVNPDSDLYRAHPDWVIHTPGRTRTTARNQLILNLALPEVQVYLLDVLDRLLAAHNITFIKWDVNRSIGEMGGDRALWLTYIEGLYHVWGTLAARHPKVTWQSCSGGGGRADLGVLRIADQIWVSDNTEGAARLQIQEGFSLLFPPNVMEAWVTDMNPQQLSLEFRFHVSMCGALGIGGHLLRWSEAERAQAAKLIAQYKALRPIIQFGDLYRLASPSCGAFSSVQYVSKDQRHSVLFAFRTHAPHPTNVPYTYPRGLNPTARYRIGAEVRSGAGWMAIGLMIDLANFESKLLQIEQVD